MAGDMPASIGAVVPNYNYARYLPERIASILAQERMPGTLVFLDDLSTDNSWAIAPALLAPFPGRLVTHRNTVRSGSPLRQWRAGLDRLDTDLVWIAEADDRCAPGLLAALAARLEADPAARFAFCDSAPIDPEGNRLAEDSQAYYRTGEANPLAEDAVFPASEFLRRCLLPKNMVVNASAVLWRAEALGAALREVEGELGHWLCAGDWRAYAAACLQGGTVHYLATPLNEHRRHGGSVTRATQPARHFGEVVLMHSRLRAALGPDAERDAAMRRHLADLRRAWKLDPQGAAA
jgi:glycosyltransferase involved in cell wall biosynthesis